MAAARGDDYYTERDGRFYRVVDGIEIGPLNPEDVVIVGDGSGKSLPPLCTIEVRLGVLSPGAEA